MPTKTPEEILSKSSTMHTFYVTTDTEELKYFLRQLGFIESDSELVDVSPSYTTIFGHFYQLPGRNGNRILANFRDLEPDEIREARGYLGFPPMARLVLRREYEVSDKRYAKTGLAIIRALSQKGIFVGLQDGENISVTKNYVVQKVPW